MPANRAADAVAARQEEMHQEQLERDRSRAGTDDRADNGPAMPGDPYPAPPLPGEVLGKPGNESELTLTPQYSAPDYKGSEKLLGKVAIVTGGDSGIGRAVAILYAREGADVVIAYLNEHADAEQTKSEVEREGRRALTISGDIRDREFCRSVVDQTVQTFGAVDILVNNAAFQLHAREIGEISEARLEETFRTNVFGCFHMTEAAIGAMAPGSAIINSGSVVGLQGSEHLLDYAATKGAIHAFTKSLARNLIGKGIRVNAVAPGPVWTPLNPADKSSEEIEKFGSDTDMKRPAQPEELSPAYVFLAAPSCASYITGIVLPVTGSI